MRGTWLGLLCGAMAISGCGSKDPAADSAFSNDSAGSQSAQQDGGNAEADDTSASGSGGRSGTATAGMNGASGSGADEAGSSEPSAGQGAGEAGSIASEAGSDGSAAGSGTAEAGSDGSEAGTSGSEEPCPDGMYLPMAVGNSWTYRVTDPVDGVSTKVTTVDSMEVVGGSGPHQAATAYHVITQKSSGAQMDMTESWQDVLSDGSVVRYRELGYKTGTTQVNTEDSWDPYKMRFDQSADHITANATWNELYDETKTQKNVTTSAARNDGWVVDAVDVPCGPVNGEMLSCIQVRKTADGAASGKTYLYARCVGKVREEGTQVEELTDYTVQ